MKQHFKEEELIMYIYKDCTPALNAAIDKALREDVDLQDKVDQIRRAVAQLDSLQLKSPSR
ncbi:hypothetical protein, partial [Streptomyces turgidiscabies]|uniref:hypothetical protein n=1 Tax=Streptomyces turgidiscabies TaxID=85558 RepID=UPI0038F71E93